MITLSLHIKAKPGTRDVLKENAWRSLLIMNATTN